MFKGLSTIEGTFNQNGIEIKYWSKYTSDGKTMYFEPKKDTLPQIKGLRRNKKYGYYTNRGVGIRTPIELIINAYKG